MATRVCSSIVSKFYEGKSVFITGGTGFVGKVLIEKLLYRCTDIDKVYILIRKNAQHNEKQRIEVLLQSRAFTRLRAERPEALGKIVPIAGDLTLPNLGIKPQDEDTLLEKVGVVFNVAASTNFTDPLRQIFALNVEGTDKVLDIGRRMKRLEGFVHFSTAFCNYNRQVVEEVVYPPPARIVDVYKFLDHEGNRKALKKLLNGYPNTYPFTKALAETLVVEKRGNMPTVILRPSIVMPSLAEPMEGWVDDWQGAVGLLMAASKGRIKTIVGADHYITDLIPVDYVANMAVIAATKCITSKVAVYNCSTSAVNPLTCKETATYFIGEAVKNGLNDVSHPHVTFCKNASIVDVFAFLELTGPAYCLDLVRVLRNQKPRYVKGAALLTKLRKLMQPFIARSWQFRSERAQALARSLSPADRRLFPCHPADIRWESYLAACYRGVERYLINKKSI